MGRPDPKSKKGSPASIIEVHTLSNESRNKLIELLGYDSEKDKDNNNLNLRLMDVADYLSSYFMLVEAFDNAPRPADYRDMFKELKKKSETLLNNLTEMNMFYREQFKREDSPVDLNDIEKALKSIIDVSAGVIKEYKSKSSKGARKNIALMEVILNLRGIFRKNYRGEYIVSTKKKAFEKRSTEEIYEFEFVETALLDANIIHVDKSTETLERYFRDKRCIPK